MRRNEALDADERSWDRRFLEAGGHPWGWDPNALVVEVASGLSPGVALDLGAGEGRNTRWLAERGWRVTAVDISQVALEELRESTWGQGWEITTVHTDVRTWTPPPAAFDLVLLSFLQITQPARGRLHRLAAAALRPGGTLILVAHDRSNLDGGVGGPQDAALLPVASEVTRELDQLRIERAEVVLRPVAGSERPARDLLVVALAPSASVEGRSQG